MARALTLREFLLNYPSPFPPEARGSHERSLRLATPCPEMACTDGSEGAEFEEEMLKKASTSTEALRPL